MPIKKLAMTMPKDLKLLGITEKELAKLDDSKHKPMGGVPSPALADLLKEGMKRSPKFKEMLQEDRKNNTYLVLPPIKRILIHLRQTNPNFGYLKGANLDSVAEGILSGVSSYSYRPPQGPVQFGPPKGIDWQGGKFNKVTEDILKSFDLYDAPKSGAALKEYLSQESPEDVTEGLAYYIGKRDSEHINKDNMDSKELQKYNEYRKELRERPKEAKVRDILALLKLMYDAKVEKGTMRPVDKKFYDDPGLQRKIESWAAQTKDTEKKETPEMRPDTFNSEMGNLIERVYKTGTYFDRVLSNLIGTDAQKLSTEEVQSAVKDTVKNMFPSKGKLLEFLSDIREKLSVLPLSLRYEIISIPEGSFKLPNFSLESFESKLKEKKAKATDRFNKGKIEEKDYQNALKNTEKMLEEISKVDASDVTAAQESIKEYLKYLSDKYEALNDTKQFKVSGDLVSLGNKLTELTKDLNKLSRTPNFKRFWQGIHSGQGQKADVNPKLKELYQKRQERLEEERETEKVAADLSAVGIRNFDEVLNNISSVRGSKGGVDLGSLKAHLIALHKKLLSMIGASEDNILNPYEEDFSDNPQATGRLNTDALKESMNSILGKVRKYSNFLSKYDPDDLADEVREVLLKLTDLNGIVKGNEIKLPKPKNLKKASLSDVIRDFVYRRAAEESLESAKARKDVKYERGGGAGPRPGGSDPDPYKGPQKSKVDWFVYGERLTPLGKKYVEDFWEGDAFVRNFVQTMYKHGLNYVKENPDLEPKEAEKYLEEIIDKSFEEIAGQDMSRLIGTQAVQTAKANKDMKKYEKEMQKISRGIEKAEEEQIKNYEKLVELSRFADFLSNPLKNLKQKLEEKKLSLPRPEKKDLEEAKMPDITEEGEGQSIEAEDGDPKKTGKNIQKITINMGSKYGKADRSYAPSSEDLKSSKFIVPTQMGNYLMSRLNVLDDVMRKVKSESNKTGRKSIEVLKNSVNKFSEFIAIANNLSKYATEGSAVLENDKATMENLLAYLGDKKKFKAVQDATKYDLGKIKQRAQVAFSDFNREYEFYKKELLPRLEGIIENLPKSKQLLERSKASLEKGQIGNALELLEQTELGLDAVTDEEKDLAKDFAQEAKKEKAERYERYEQLHQGISKDKFEKAIKLIYQVYKLDLQEDKDTRGVRSPATPAQTFVFPMRVSELLKEAQQKEIDLEERINNITSEYLKNMMEGSYYGKLVKDSEQVLENLPVILKESEEKLELLKKSVEEAKAFLKQNGPRAEKAEEFIEANKENEAVDIKEKVEKRKRLIDNLKKYKKIAEGSAKRIEALEKTVDTEIPQQIEEAKKRLKDYRAKYKAAEKPTLITDDPNKHANILLKKTLKEIMSEISTWREEWLNKLGPAYKEIDEKLKSYATDLGLTAGFNDPKDMGTKVVSDWEKLIKDFKKIQSLITSVEGSADLPLDLKTRLDKVTKQFQTIETIAEKAYNTGQKKYSPKSFENILSVIAERKKAIQSNPNIDANQAKQQIDELNRAVAIYKELKVSVDEIEKIYDEINSIKEEAKPKGPEETSTDSPRMDLNTDYEELTRAKGGPRRQDLPEYLEKGSLKGEPQKAKDKIKIAFKSPDPGAQKGQVSETEVALAKGQRATQPTGFKEEGKSGFPTEVKGIELLDKLLIDLKETKPIMEKAVERVRKEVTERRKKEQEGDAKAEPKPLLKDKALRGNKESLDTINRIMPVIGYIKNLDLSTLEGIGVSKPTKFKDAMDALDERIQSYVSIENKLNKRINELQDKSIRIQKESDMLESFYDDDGNFIGFTDKEKEALKRQVLAYLYRRIDEFWGKRAGPNVFGEKDTGYYDNVFQAFSNLSGVSSNRTLMRTLNELKNAIRSVYGDERNRTKAQALKSEMERIRKDLEAQGEDVANSELYRTKEVEYNNLKDLENGIEATLEYMAQAAAKKTDGVLRGALYNQVKGFPGIGGEPKAEDSEKEVANAEKQIQKIVGDVEKTISAEELFPYKSEEEIKSIGEVITKGGKEKTNKTKSKPKKVTDTEIAKKTEKTEVDSIDTPKKLAQAATYIVKHSKGDHKYVFIVKNNKEKKELIDSGLIKPDSKGRKKGTEYLKDGKKIYDVKIDMYEFPGVTSKDGDPADVWVGTMKDYSNQLNAIKKGMGGGVNFSGVEDGGRSGLPKSDEGISIEKGKKEVPSEIKESSYRNDVNFNERILYSKTMQSKLSSLLDKTLNKIREDA